jgi:hypothetical protein
MLLNNFIATMYPCMKATGTTGIIRINDETRFSEAGIKSFSSDCYLDTTEGSYFAPFDRGIAFGSGTTPPQKTDYKLENYITTGLTYSGNNTNQTDGVANWVQTVQNTSTAQITITEVGLFSRYAYTGGRFDTFLLTRTVLDTPVVLQPNEVKTFTITIDYNKFVDGTIIQNE